MSENQDDFGAGVFASVFERTQNVWVDDISCDTRHKQIANLGVENVLNGRAAVNASKHCGVRELSSSSAFEHFCFVSVARSASLEAFVTLDKPAQGFMCGKCGLEFFVDGSREVCKRSHGE